MKVERSPGYPGRHPEQEHDDDPEDAEMPPDIYKAKEFYPPCSEPRCFRFS